MIMDFSGSPGVTYPCFHHKGLGFDFWSGMSHGVAKIKNKKRSCP